MTDALCLIRRDTTRRMARFYRVQIAPDLFGGAVLIRQWGRIGTQGQERRQWLADMSLARTALQVWVTRKQRRGYVIPTPETHPPG